MADSNSLLLLPPRHTAQSAATASSKKTNKPTHGESFGKKLDKAKKQIVVAKVAPPAVADADEKDTEAAAKTTDPQTPEETDATKDPTASTADKKVVKQTKAAAGKATDTEKSDETDEDTHAATKPVTEAESAVDKPKKAAHAEKKNGSQPVDKKAENVKAAAVQPTAAKKPDTAAASTSAAQSTVQASTADSSNAADTDVDTDSDSALASTDGIAPASSPFYGSAKVVTQNGSASQTNASTDAADAANDSTASPDATVATATADSTEIEDSAPAKTDIVADTHTPGISTDVSGLTSPTTSGAPTAVAAKAVAHAASPQVQFTEDNHPKIITSIAGQLMPKGGTMQLQLNPAELGALQVTVHLQDGVMTASFQTSNEDATKLLSHSLGQLKTGLEAAGVSVEKLHVEQAPQKDAKNDSESDSKSPAQEQQKNAQQDQQRREMVQKMWRRLAGGSDPLDMVA